MPLTVTTSLPRVRYTFCCDAAPERLWRVRRVVLVEALSQPYELALDLRVDLLELDAASLLASSCELVIDRDGLARTICGVVARVEVDGPLEDQLAIRLLVVPALRLLGPWVDTRHWQDRSALAVAVEVLRLALVGYGRELDIDRLTRRYPVRELIVQYAETDLDFCARLLAEEGISYHFDHERGTGCEVLTLVDDGDQWMEVPTLDDGPALPVITSRPEQADVESLQRLTWARYGLARVRKGSRVLRGTSNVIGIAPGRRFRVAAIDRPELAELEFLVTRVVSRGGLGEAEGAEEYANEFECVVFDGEPWRPEPPTVAPKIPATLDMTSSGSCPTTRPRWRSSS